MSEAQEIIQAARARRSQREACQSSRKPTDYAALNKMVRRQRRELLAAIKSADRDRVVIACRDAVKAWREPEAMWPDDWSTWQIALDDALGIHGSVLLEDL